MNPSRNRMKRGIYVLEGSGLAPWERGDVPIEAGQFMIVPRGVPHGKRNTGATRRSYPGVDAGAEPPAGGV